MEFFLTIQRCWRWLLPLLVVVPLSVFSSDLTEIYYNKIERPGLIKLRSAMPCAEYTAVLKDHLPATCDLALPATETDGVVTESYFFADGSRLVHESKNGKWHSSSAECTPIIRSFWVGIVGFALLCLSRLLYIFRTGEWPNWSWAWASRKVEPVSDAELVIAIYGAAIFGGYMISMAMSHCSAMAPV